MRCSKCGTPEMRETYFPHSVVYVCTNCGYRKEAKDSQKVLRVQAYLAAGKDYRRWRLWKCIEGAFNERNVEAREEIEWLQTKEFKAKIWAPLPEHKVSGHTHIVVLTTFKEFCKLAGLEVQP